MAQILDAYLRVSRVGGREGHSYHSPDIQMAAIERWIAQHPETELGKVVKEENVSGGTRIAKRQLNVLLLRVEHGVSNGIIVYETDRFGRDLTETLIAQRRLKEANGRLVGADDGVDTDEPSGKSRLIQRALMAEEYLDDVKRRWQNTTNRRVEQGKHTGHVPIGYRRRETVEPEYDSRGNLIRDGRLIIDEETAPLVLRAFQMRVAGASHLEIAREIGRKKANVTHILKNRIYLGEIRGSGGAINRRAHEPIISDELFGAVQSMIGTRAPRSDRKRLYEPLLNGLIRCAHCGCLLQLANSTRAGGVLTPHYFCPSRSNNRPCVGCGAAAKRVDDLVVSLLDLEDDRIADLFHGAERAWAAAKQRVADAEAELDGFVDAASSLDRERLQRGISMRQATLNDAKRELYELDDPGLSEDMLVVDFGQGPVVVEGRGDNPQRDRRRMRRVIAKVTLSRTDHRRRHQPISERVSVEWVGEAASSEK